MEVKCLLFLGPFKNRIIPLFQNHLSFIFWSGGICIDSILGGTEGKFRPDR